MSLIYLCKYGIAALEHGKQIHQRILDSGLEWTIPLATA